MRFAKHGRERNIDIPTSVPDGLIDEFSADAGKKSQSLAFNLNVRAPEFDRVVRELRKDIVVLTALRANGLSCILR